MNVKVLPSISIVVPVGKNEQAWVQLVSDLSALPDSVQVVLVGVRPLTPAERTLLAKACPQKRICWMVEHMGRAKQMNAGARAASGDYIWFLHADSKVEIHHYQSLLRSILKQSEALHYFDLGFLSDGPKLTRLNCIGAWIRSHFLGIPFGDQGFCLSKELFGRLGEFDESLEFGEDHALVWRARLQGVRARCTGAKLFTSARKYKNKGWLRVTLQHLATTITQASSEIFRSPNTQDPSKSLSK